MEFNDLKSQYTLLESKIQQRISNVLAHGQFIMGPEVFELESVLEEYLKINHAITCANGTDAILLALMAIDIGPGDAVFTTPFTFTATAEPISLLGATPVFVDIEKETLNIAADSLNRAIIRVKQQKKLTAKAVIAVDLFGYPADYDALNKACIENSLTLIEDAAQSLGGSYRDRKCGSLGKIATTSFFPSKPLGCYGDGGAVFTNCPEIANRITSLKLHGKGSNKYENINIGINSRLDSLQAAILLEKIKLLDTEVQMRNAVAAQYSELVKQNSSSLNYDKSLLCAYAQYTITVPPTLRGEAISKLKEKGIPTQIYYPTPLNRSKAYAAYSKYSEPTPISDSAAQQVLSLPMSAYLKKSEIQNVARALEYALSK